MRTLTQPAACGPTPHSSNRRVGTGLRDPSGSEENPHSEAKRAGETGSSVWHLTPQLNVRGCSIMLIGECVFRPIASDTEYLSIVMRSADHGVA